VAEKTGDQSDGDGSDQTGGGDDTADDGTGDEGSDDNGSDGAVPVTGVSISKDTLELVSGETAQLEATVDPPDASDPRVTWQSDDESVATVGTEGAVTAVAPGTVNIQVVTNDGGFTAAAALDVSAGGILDTSFNGQGFATHDN
jgi:uncharacterized protein YjdB